MPINLKSLNEQVMVITGATSGIGLTTALAAARKGVRLVLAARTVSALADAEKQIKAATPEAQVMTVPTDVSKREDLQKLCDAAVKKFGRIDTWVNNAGVSVYGKLQEVANDDFQQIIDTNFWGIVNGSLIATRHMKQSGGGAIINLGSELSEHGITLQGMYAASKHAVKGFTDSLRMELDEEGAPISITLIKPAAIATPFADHAKNYTGQEAGLPQPIYAPEEVAYAILHAATTPTRDAFIGGGAKASSVMSKVAPRVFDWMAEKIGKSQLRDEAPHGQGDNLYSGYSQANTRGRNMNFVMEKSLYTRASLHPLVTSLIAAGVVAGATFLFMANRSTPPQPAYKRYRQHFKEHAPAYAELFGKAEPVTA